MEIIQVTKTGFLNNISSNVYLIKNGSNSILIDTSTHIRKVEILESLKKNISALDDIVLIILTHTHFDHTGCVAFLKKYLKNAKIVVHKSEAHLLENGKCIIPKGNTFFSNIMSYVGDKLHNYTSYGNYDPITPDVLVGKKFPLEKYKFGKKSYILHTPGHSKGSVSIILNEEVAFVGDMMNYNWNTVYNPLADDEVLNISQWKKLLDLGIKEFYPGHGTKISRDIVQKMYDKYKKS